MVAHTECADRKFFLPSHKGNLVATLTMLTTIKKMCFTNTTLRRFLICMYQKHKYEYLATQVVPYDRHSHLME